MTESDYMQQRLMHVQCNMYALIARMEGMKAENLYRQDCGNSVAYAKEAFDSLANEFNSLAQQVYNP